MYALADRQGHFGVFGGRYVAETVMPGAIELLGAEGRGVTSGRETLKDAINEALRHWLSNVETTYYLVGSTMSAHPYPMIVRDFQSVIGRETRQQILRVEGKLPDVLVACVGG